MQNQRRFLRLVPLRRAFFILATAASSFLRLWPTFLISARTAAGFWNSTLSPFQVDHELDHVGNAVTDGRIRELHSRLQHAGCEPTQRLFGRIRVNRRQCAGVPRV